MERKGIARSQSQTFYPTPFVQERKVIVQFDWLLVRQSKSDIKNLAFRHNPTTGTRLHQNIHMVESEESFKFSVQETLKDLSPNDNDINLKPEQEAAIRV